MTAIDATQPIDYLNCNTIETPLPGSPPASPGRARHRAPSRSRRLREAPSWAAVGAVWSLVWPPLIGIVLGTLIAVSLAITLVTIWLHTL